MDLTRRGLSLPGADGTRLSRAKMLPILAGGVVAPLVLGASSKGHFRSGTFGPVTKVQTVPGAVQGLDANGNVVISIAINAPPNTSYFTYYPTNTVWSMPGNTRPPLQFVPGGAPQNVLITASPPQNGYQSVSSSAATATAQVSFGAPVVVTAPPLWSGPMTLGHLPQWLPGGGKGCSKPPCQQDQPEQCLIDMMALMGVTVILIANLAALIGAPEISPQMAANIAAAMLTAEAAALQESQDCQTDPFFMISPWIFG